jgi:hypothetical protein
MENSTTKVPFFIIGCPRSGTTLLQLLINSHPKIAIPPESHIFVRFSKIFENYGDLNNKANLKLFVQDLLKDYHIRDWDLGVSVDDFCDQLKEKSLRNVIALLLELYAQKDLKIRWGDKTPQHMLHVREIKKIFPEAKFIHLIRDGRDVAVSSSRIFVGPPSIYGIAHEWRKYIEIFDKFKKNLNHNEYLEVRYEDLVRNPEAELKKIFIFLKEEPIAASKGQNLPNSTAKEYYIQTDAHMLSLNAPISDKKIGTYKKKFTTREIEIFETITKDSLTKLGYELTTNADAKITIIEKLLFYIKDKLYRYYRKYFRPKEINKAWILFRREAQFYLRSFIRSKRKMASQRKSKT